jgi:hypothetical protein
MSLLRLLGSAASVLWADIKRVPDVPTNGDSLA